MIGGETFKAFKAIPKLSKGKREAVDRYEAYLRNVDQTVDQVENS